MNRDRIFLRTDVVGPRLRYVAKEIFERHLGLELVLVNESEPLAIGSVCIGYGIAGQNILIPKSGILEERDFEFNWPGLHKIGAETIENEYVWNDDILGLIFWFLSRFEEYSKSKKSDEHGRYPSSCSMAAMHQILHIPFVDIWVNSLFNQLICNELKPTRVAYERKITIDIDNPTAYRHKGFLRTLAGFGQDILTANFRNANERFQAILNLKEDPYDRFEAIENWLSNEIKPIFFFWIGDYGQFDKGLNWHNPYFQSLVKKYLHIILLDYIHHIIHFSVLKS